MSNKVLITRPRHDITTRYLFAWAEKIVNFAQKKHFDVLDLSKERANKKEIISMLKKMEPFLVFCNGHGDKNLVAGHDNEVLLEVGENERLTKSKIIYALSCKSAKKLGPKCIKAGALAYIGYDDDFVFIHEEKTTRVLGDKIAALFLDPSNQIMISLLKGHTSKEAYERSQSYFKKNIQKLVNSESEDNNLVPFLLWDREHQVCLDNKK
ncbi:MAG: hypothetical protein ABID45_04815 [Patescibacteria group bacterium]